MIIAKTKTGAAAKTVSIMRAIVNRYYGDIKEPLKNMDLLELFNFVKNQPYRRDPAGREIIPRPLYTLRYGSRLGRDCKKQAIIIAAWARANSLPFKFVVVSTEPEKTPHHVFTSVFWGGRWVDVDATYKTNKIDEKKNWTYRAEY